jgi:peptidoglycan/xylan/chitin deacetylase (PgdA/CDA1 family)
MKISALSALIVAAGVTTSWSQSAPELKVPNEAPPLPDNVKIMRAIPVEAPPVINVAALPRTLPPEAKVVYSQCHVEGNVIALTFDDGPHPENTPRLLDMLKERGIKATFFLIGKSAATWPKIVKRIVDEGHEIANHTWSHPQLNHMKSTSVMDQLQKTHDAIVKGCGVAPLVYRPPYGAILLSQRKAIHEKFGYRTILWDVDPIDWKTPRSSTKVHDRVLAQTKPGSIILCHDIHKETVDAMPATIDELIARGFQFATVTQLINLDVQTAAKNEPAPLAAIPVTIEKAQAITNSAKADAPASASPGTDATTK